VHQLNIYDRRDWEHMPSAGTKHVVHPSLDFALAEIPLDFKGEGTSTGSSSMEATLSFLPLQPNQAT